MRAEPGIRAPGPALTTSHHLEGWHVMALNHSTPSAKLCLTCGSALVGKPSAVAKRTYCSNRCRAVFSVGAGNPNWRGGLIDKVCLHCGGGYRVFPTKSDAQYCSHRCSVAGTALFGPDNPRWKGGPAASKRRYREKRAVKKGRVHTGPRPRVVRVCRKCGLSGVKKGRFFHPECSPISKGMVAWTCPDCGECRSVVASKARQSVRCFACRIKSIGGPNNPNWKGGITPAYQKIRASDRYKAWRLAVFERDHYTCVWCDQRGGMLNADHIKPFSSHPRLRFTLSNGRTLCVPCHKKTSSYLAKGRRRPVRLNQGQFAFDDPKGGS
jgi:5-methylcytosine-specific restriction endonuclease McrA